MAVVPWIEVPPRIPYHTSPSGTPGNDARTWVGRSLVFALVFAWNEHDAEWMGWAQGGESGRVCVSLGVSVRVWASLGESGRVWASLGEKRRVRAHLDASGRSLGATFLLLGF